MTKKIKCHIKTKEKVNPYCRYSYNSGTEFRNDWTGEHHPAWGIDSDWLLWQLKHGKDIGDITKIPPEPPKPPEIEYRKEHFFDILFHL